MNKLTQHKIDKCRLTQCIQQAELKLKEDSITQ